MIKRLNQSSSRRNLSDVRLFNLNFHVAGEDIYFSLGNLSFNYKLKSDLSNFDKILLSNALIDVVISG